MQGIKKYTILASSLISGSVFAQTEISTANSSTVNASYVEPSAEKIISPSDKLNNLFERNMSQSYILQKIGERTYYVQRYFYSTTFYVGDKGVLLFDAPEGRGKYLLQAIRDVTPLPVTALVYSHYHVDHIGDSPFWNDEAKKEGVNLRIIASKATAEKMQFMNSRLPVATQVLSKKDDQFKFEKQTIELHRFVKAGHTDDHSVWLLKQEKVAHSPDLLNPDQLPMMGFAVSDTLVYHDSNLRQVEMLDWKYFIGGHGNIGSHDDFKFQRQFLNDLRDTTIKVRKEESFGKFMNKTANNHADFARAQREAIIKKVTEVLRPKYGHMYGYDASMPANIEMAIRLVGSYY
ncbi:TPA: MBL fold metallo-hydrolase [Escherichia coli]|jgi:glyoxylase-like metal-dependent hydrolase (beta-lactamase superfamily II)|uniref:Beta-lactamase-like protein n=2 Tax=Escherichia coli TaxID=562 RepID=A0A376D2U2_ECOLX|nr:MBL fold metallo-hydrolase [Escherichia coli]EFA6264394.1 MBL fold metallo-hydrolase [Escherichia coli]EFI7813015.1 MBL fold metallo-hydrolase [Escherichia coli]EFK3879141.1 MBL fold metallo-hydrolase [Escherichia coli]EFK6679398.1 MBL fold metallo-hydrolase [Escherichia coli]EGE1653926.1 MBL fold metallo-hydrolase [Escherichia coli]